MLLLVYQMHFFGVLFLFKFPVASKNLFPDVSFQFLQGFVQFFFYYTFMKELFRLHNTFWTHFKCCGFLFKIAKQLFKQKWIRFCKLNSYGLLCYKLCLHYSYTFIVHIIIENICLFVHSVHAFNLMLMLSQNTNLQ